MFQTIKLREHSVCSYAKHCRKLDMPPFFKFIVDYIVAFLMCVFVSLKSLKSTS